MTDIIEVIDDGTIVAVVEQTAAVVIEVPQDDAPAVVEIHVPGPQGPGSTVEIGGADMQVQFNDNGALGGDPALTFDAYSDLLSITGEHGYAVSLSPYGVSIEHGEAGVAMELRSELLRFTSTAGNITIVPPTIVEPESKVMVVADSQVIDDRSGASVVEFGDTVLAFNNDISLGLNGLLLGTTETGVLVGSYSVSARYTEHSGAYYTKRAAGFSAPNGLFSATITTEGGYAFVGGRLLSDSLSFETADGDITVAPPAGMATSIDIQLPAESGTLARVEDITIAIDAIPDTVIVVAMPSSSAGVLTLDFAGKSRAVFAVTLTENITSILHTNVPTGVFLEYEIHYTQGGAGGFTVAQPASHKALGGSDTVVSTTVGKVTVQSAASVDGGTTWRYAMQESG